MKRTVKVKNLIAFTAVLILLISLTVAPAYADLIPQRIKAGIASAITALNITMNSTIAPVQEMIDYIGDPFDVRYTWAEMWNDRPQIQIWDDYVEIDGKQYTDIWISNEAAEKFRVNAFDFITAKNIASNDSGIFASGDGTLGGIPLYSINENWAQTQFMETPGGNSQYNYYDYGPFTIRSWLTSNPSRYSIDVATSVTGQGSWTTISQSNLTNPPLPKSQYQVGKTGSNANKVFFNANYDNTNHFQQFLSNGSYYLNWTPFDYDYVSQTIPPNTSLPSDTGMMIRVPSNDPQGNPYFDTFLHDNPEFNTGEPLTIDVNLDPDIMIKLDDLFDIIAPIIPVINNNFGDVNFVENHEAPAPVPDTPIVDATVPQVVNPIINEITNYGDQINEQIPNIIESIPNITEICNNIDTAPYHDLDTGLDRLPSFFLPFITDLRSALGIWHYVTEWLAQISTTFAFISGCLVGTSIMTPIYAAIAGFMCIKIYRRMTA